MAFNNCWLFLKSQKYFLFELFVVLRLTATSMNHLTVQLLVQDKLCLHQYNQSRVFCENIHSVRDVPVKDQILAKAALFGNYQTLIQLAPMFVWSLFVGSFLDRFADATRRLLVLIVCGDFLSSLIFQVNVFLYHSSSFYTLFGSGMWWFTGGTLTFQAAVYRFVVLHSDQKYRVVKFATFQICFRVAQSLGTYLGGHLLQFRGKGPQLRTYDDNFGLAIIMNLFSFVIIFFLGQSNQSDTTEQGTIVAQQDNDNNNQDEEESYECSWMHQWRALFEWQHVRQTVVCMFKKRDNHGRAQIMLMFAIIFFHVTVIYGTNDILLQFTEKVYHWNAAHYSSIFAVAKITTTLFLTIVSYLLLKYWGVEEGTLIMIALVSEFLSQLMIGTFLDTYIFYLSIPVGSLAGLTTVAVRARLSKMVASDELGKIYSLYSSFESILPFLGSFIYSNIFALTISNYPGLVFQCSAFIVLLALLVTTVEQIFVSREAKAIPVSSFSTI